MIKIVIIKDDVLKIVRLNEIPDKCEWMKDNLKNR